MLSVVEKRGVSPPPPQSAPEVYPSALPLMTKQRMNVTVLLIEIMVDF